MSFSSAKTRCDSTFSHFPQSTVSVHVVVDIVVVDARHANEIVFGTVELVCHATAEELSTHMLLSAISEELTPRFAHPFDEQPQKLLHRDDAIFPAKN